VVTFPFSAQTFSIKTLGVGRLERIRFGGDIPILCTAFLYKDFGCWEDREDKVWL